MSGDPYFLHRYRRAEGSGPWLHPARPARRHRVAGRDASPLSPRARRNRVYDERLLMTFLALVLAIVIIITLDEPERVGCHTYTSTCVSPIAASVASASLPAQAVSLSGMAVTGVRLNTSASCARRAASMSIMLSTSQAGRCRPLCAAVVNASDTIKLAQA